MWNITSNDVQQAKGRLQLRRAKLETRYAEETKALDAEFAAIEALERVAEEFALKHGREHEPVAPEATAPTDPPDGGSEGGSPLEGVASAAEFSAPAERRDGANSGIGLDILKPGSRWRMYRSTRPNDGETIASGAAPTQ